MKKTLSPLPALTSKEKSVLEFIENELLDKGLCPSYQEICDHFGFASFNSVQNYLKQLSNKGYLHIPQNQKRAIQILRSAKDFQKDLVDRLSTAEPLNGSLKHQSSPNENLGDSQSRVLPIPLLGKVAAGIPLERLNHDEFVYIPDTLVKFSKQLFALTVEGNSMIDEGIFDGDILIIQSQSVAKDGDLVVASIENEATVKRFYKKINPENPQANQQVELRPSNALLKSMWYSPKAVEIKGLVKALFRTYS